MQKKDKKIITGWLKGGTTVETVWTGKRPTTKRQKKNWVGEVQIAKKKVA